MQIKEDYTGGVQPALQPHQQKKYLLPFILVTFLFFLWGMAHNLDSILIPHLKKACQLSNRQSALVDTAVFFAYFAMAIPAGVLLKKWGYKKSIITGLCLFAAGAYLFIPAADGLSYGLFLLALFIIGCGLAVLETSANPYAAILGPPEKATDRLNFAASFNGLAAMVAPLLGTRFILSGKTYSEESLAAMPVVERLNYFASEAAAVKMPYFILGTVLVLVAVLFLFMPLPEMKLGQQRDDERGGKGFFAVLKHRHLSLGVVSQFFYVGAQVCITSFFIRMAQQGAGLDEKTAGYYLGIYGFLFMLGRFIGTFLLKFIRPQRLLAIYAFLAILLAVLAIVEEGMVVIYALGLIGFFMSIMFPTIFALAIKDLGHQTKAASSWLVMSVVGGAVLPYLMGALIDMTGDNTQIGYLIPLACFVLIFLYAWKGAIPKKVLGVLILLGAISFGNPVMAQEDKLPAHTVETKAPQGSEGPWVFWYWMHSSYSKEGIKADLAAMKEVGISGVYLAPIKGKTDPPLLEPVIETLSPQWWELLRYTFNEAKDLGIKLAFLPNDGFATAGGPWITPELSMQKVVWADTVIAGGQNVQARLPQPEAYQHYYQDIATFAMPARLSDTRSSEGLQPEVSTSTGVDAQFLAEKGNKKNFSSKQPCWIQYQFEEPFLCQAIKINVQGFNYQSGRLIVETSDDGIHFKRVTRLKPPRAGWLDWDVPVTHAIPAVRAKYFRFVYDPEGSEPGAEDLDAAKWKPSLKLCQIKLLSAVRLNQYEGKTSMVWRISERTNEAQVADALAVPKDSLINISSSVSKEGVLRWDAPKGNWLIVRMGHTSTGHKNETAGAGKGLECDKLNLEAVKIQFDHWFKRTIQEVGPELASEVLKVFHVDSWECGSQNWSPVFQQAFQKRRGYDPVPYLPAMAGIPVESAAISERFLYDVRQTISELMVDNFFHTLADLSRETGVRFTAETTAPVMAADGMLHFKEVDVPMGEFWLRSPSHDKPNDMLDAISAAHIYGKRLVQAEAFTEIRMQWDEHPGALKALQDRNYALGINNLVYHVMVQNPWLDRKPGMTLDGIGLYFQRDQTWWKQGKAWVDYAKRSHALLQQGQYVADVAVFTGEEYPRRAVLPDRLVSTLPGIFGEQRIQAEEKRLKNEGLPIQKVAGVSTSANMAQAEQWVNPLRGYAYDSFNADALLRLAKVEKGRIVLPGGASYALLVLPGKRPMQPEADRMSLSVAKKLLELVQNGATVMVADKPEYTLGLARYQEEEKELSAITDQLWEGDFNLLQDDPAKLWVKQVGKGRVIKGPYTLPSFHAIGIEKDVIFQDSLGNKALDMGYTHRHLPGKDIYFITNQQARERYIDVSLRIAGKAPYLYDAVKNITRPALQWKMADGRTRIPLKLPANGSLFIVFEKSSASKQENKGDNWRHFEEVQTLAEDWQLQFDTAYGGPQAVQQQKQLVSWNASQDSSIRYYSGTVIYRKTFSWNKADKKQGVWLDLGAVANIATVRVNGHDCGTIWTKPNRVAIGEALKEGENELEIAVTNTWANRLIGDQLLPPEQRITQTTAPYRLGDQEPLKAGLLGPVRLLLEQ